MKPPSRKSSQTRRQRSPHTADPTRRTAVAEMLIGSPDVKVAKIDPRWAWHFEALTRSRERLLRGRDERRAEASSPMEPHSMDQADSATDEFDHDMALSELSSEQDALFEIEEARKRIIDGSYGICEVTGEPIPAARLRAIPWTRFSREVEEELEKKGAVPRVHIQPPRSVRGPAPGGLAETEEPGPEPSGAPPGDEAMSSVYCPPGKHHSRPTRGKAAKPGRAGEG